MCYCWHLALNLVVNAVSSNCKAVLNIVSVCNVVFSGRSKMSGCGSTPTKPIPASQRGRKPSRALQIIVESAAVVSKHSLASLRVDG